VQLREVLVVKNKGDGSERAASRSIAPRSNSPSRSPAASGR
jgi:hypothetical protein